MKFSYLKKCDVSTVGPSRFILVKMQHDIATFLDYHKIFSRFFGEPLEISLGLLLEYLSGTDFFCPSGGNFHVQAKNYQIHHFGGSFLQSNSLVDVFFLLCEGLYDVFPIRRETTSDNSLKLCFYQIKRCHIPISSFSITSSTQRKKISPCHGHLDYRIFLHLFSRSCKVAQNLEKLTILPMYPSVRGYWVSVNFPPSGARLILFGYARQ